MSPPEGEMSAGLKQVQGAVLSPAVRSVCQSVLRCVSTVCAYRDLEPSAELCWFLFPRTPGVHTDLSVPNKEKPGQGDQVCLK